MDKIRIVDYRPEHQPLFEGLNRAWIEKYFRMEEPDRKVLQHPDEAILQQGGAILMATYEGTIAGTVALLHVSDDVYEFAKMAVDEAFQRKGIAEALSYAAFDKAKSLGAKKVILYSQTSLAPAMKLYQKLGFTEVPMDSHLYQRANIKMELDLEKAGEPATH